MALPMARPILLAGTYYLKQRVPVDLVHLVGRTQVKVSLRTKDPNEARRLHTAQAAAIQAHWDLLRKGPATLDDRQVDAVAGEVYRALLAKAPGGHRNAWVQQSFGGVRWVLEMAVGDCPAPRGRAVDKWEALEGILGPYVDDAVAGRCVLDERTRRRILEKAAVAAIQATKHVLRECEGDWRADPLAERFPSPDVLVETSTAVVDVEAVWVMVVKGCGPKTLLKYRRILDDLLAFLGTKDLGSITRKDVKSWRDVLVKRPGLAARTVQRDYLGSIKAIFACAARNDLLTVNPAEGVTVEEARLTGRRKMRGFTDEEAAIILKATFAPCTDRTSRKLAHARRWVPWLCAYTGARVGEMTQIRRCDVIVRDGHWCVRITPEAGTVKGKDPHDVPLHEHLIAQGFIAFVEDHGEDEPLFHKPRAADVVRKTFPSEATAKALAKWVRALGVTDPAVHPLHGWRHRFKTDGRYSGMRAHELDALQGHAIAGMGGRYGEFPARVTAREIAKLPRYEVGTVATKASRSLDGVA